MSNKFFYKTIIFLSVFLLGFFNSGVTEASGDIIPPKFKALDFSSEGVVKGESTIVYIDAEDQISGIKEATLMLRSPSGSQSEYLWLNKKDSLGRLSGELQVPSDAELGIWEVGYISIEDNAYNYWKYFYQDGFAYEYDNLGNIQYIETTPFTINIIENSSETLDILKELKEMQAQQYENMASIEIAFSVLTQYEGLIGRLPSGEDKNNLVLRLQACKLYLINQFKVLTKENATDEITISKKTIEFLVKYAIEEVNAVSTQDKGKILGFLKPIIKESASGMIINQVISEKLN